MNVYSSLGIRNSLAMIINWNHAIEILSVMSRDVLTFGIKRKWISRKFILIKCFFINIWIDCEYKIVNIELNVIKLMPSSLIIPKSLSIKIKILHRNNAALHSSWWHKFSLNSINSEQTITWKQQEER